MTGTDQGTKTARDTIRVDLGARAYDIVVGQGVIEDAGGLIARHLKRPRTFIVTDQNVAKAVLPKLQASLDTAGIAHDTHILPAGEATKSFDQLEALLDVLLGAKLERDDVILALGGGVIGDLTGFAASIFKRGIDFIQIPTTLLSQVDSSVGGKTGVNTRFGKNLIGSFHQPKLVLADIDVLSSLPPRELRAGYAEVVKYGLINQPEFFDWLEANGAKVLAGDAQARTYAVAQSCRSKAAIVAEDEREGGRRALLNLGHTFGHALEAETGYGPSLNHGEGVAVGMVLAHGFSVQEGLASGQDLDRIKAHLAAVGLLTSTQDIPGGPFDADALLTHMYQDKKASGGALTFILTRGIGAAFVARDVAPDPVRAFLSTSP